VQAQQHAAMALRLCPAVRPGHLGHRLATDVRHTVPVPPDLLCVCGCAPRDSQDEHDDERYERTMHVEPVSHVVLRWLRAANQPNTARSTVVTPLITNCAPMTMTIRP